MDADTIATDTAETATETSIKRAVRNAADDLARAANALATFNSNGDLTGGVAKAAVDAAATAATTAAADALAEFDNNGNLTDGVAKDAVDAAATARGAADDADSDDADDADTNTGDDEAALKGNLQTAADALAEFDNNGDLTGGAADALRDAAHALDAHMGFSINTLISSGDEEYVVVVTALEGGTPSVNVTFQGVMSTTATAPDGDSFTTNNQIDPYMLMTNVPGLLTVRTTGNEVNTKGTLDEGSADLPTDPTVAMDEGMGGNFEIVSPVKTNAPYTVYVEGQTRSESGDYGLEMEFGVANTLVDHAETMVNRELKPGRADYLFFTATNHLFLTVETQKHADVTTETNTTGSLFSQNGLIKTDTDSGTRNNFRLRAPIEPGDYIVEVKGSSSSTKGPYVLKTTSQTATTPDSSTNGNTITGEIASRTEGALVARDVKPHSINVAKPGTLQVRTTGALDTIGTLYGPDGQKIVDDDNSGQDMNFRITQAVEAGQYIVTVEGKAAETVGEYTLVVNFLEDVDLGSEGRVAELQTERDTARTERDTARTERDDLETERDTLQTQVTRLEDEAAPVEVDATGNLENPSGVRSGVGLISGWVCAANSVQIRISIAPGFSTIRLNAAYGTTRADTVNPVNQCDHQEDTTGFGMTYNFNHLPEGTYTIGAYADGITSNRIGPERTFEVVHLVEFAASDTDRFLRNLDGMCSVPDFPAAGDTTMLEWEQSIQNFVVSDVQ